MVSTNGGTQIQVDEPLIKICLCQKLLATKIDNKLRYDGHVKNFTKKE